MAGDWIKMRDNLWDDPRVASLCDATGQTEAPIIGGLYWLWAMADQHTEDGILPGLSTRAVDRKVGIPGFGAALVQIQWLAEVEGGLQIVRFDEHNGQSAKTRAQNAKRGAKFRAANAPVTGDGDSCNGDAVTDALPREEKRREENTTASTSPVERSRVSRLPPDWQPDDSDSAFLTSQRPDLDLRETASRFRDYWHAQPGAKGRKLDWPATWRNWVRNEKARARASPPDSRREQQQRNIDILTGRSNEQPEQRTIHDIN